MQFSKNTSNRSGKSLLIKIIFVLIIFIGAIVFSWSIRNYILVSTCLMGECPVKQPALYALVVAGGVVMLMTLLPKLNSPKK